MALSGIIKNGQIELESPLHLLEGTRVTVVIELAEAIPQTAKELLVQYSGCMSELPEDLARNHDHYLHGTPKK